MGNAEARKKKQQQQQIKKLEEHEKKIGIAVFFLAGENMDKIPVMEKKIFLRKKGLTQQMVEQAFKRFQEKQKQKQQKAQVQPQKTQKQSNQAKPTSIILTQTTSGDPKKQNK